MIGEPISKAFLSFECLFGRGTDPKFTSVSSSEAVMDGSRTERARARAQDLLAQIAPLPDDSELQRLRELSMDYIREAERLERKTVTTQEAGEQISAALDAIAHDFFARALQNKSRR
ncbi:hypothetical protein CQ14_02870 [Bradyrhizobium lablabi]|uniref:Uncharacterized protein n=2 Tax=Bradyrhizobium lablabi TaxID=722472 RepID=A0A0R3N292_9BRAD|nr:hypothetical protein CQ14_02870 [Bradyrhizobium lablabi]